MSGIRISPKHGVNPCIPICPFCGKEKNELALLGMLKDDAEAPMSAIIDMNPCEQCRDNWQKGVALIRVTTKAPGNGMPPIIHDNGEGLYLTAQYIVVTPECAERITGVQYGKGQPVLIEDEAFDRIVKDAKEAGVMPEESEE